MPQCGAINSPPSTIISVSRVIHSHKKRRTRCFRQQRLPAARCPYPNPLPSEISGLPPESSVSACHCNRSAFESNSSASESNSSAYHCYSSAFQTSDFFFSGSFFPFQTSDFLFQRAEFLGFISAAACLAICKRQFRSGAAAPEASRDGALRNGRSWFGEITQEDLRHDHLAILAIVAICYHSALHVA